MTAPFIISISGIRGIVDQSLTPAVVARFAAAFGRWLKPGARVVLARDTRPSGAGFAKVAAAALAQTGCHVIDLDEGSADPSFHFVLDQSDLELRHSPISHACPLLVGRERA